MITFNDDYEQIEIKECLSFSAYVLPIYNEICDEIKFNFEDFDECDLKKFLNYQLTHEDKMEILHYIEDEYERNLNYFENVSIFDEHMIKECVMSWITDNFEIEF